MLCDMHRCPGMSLPLNTDLRLKWKVRFPTLKTCTSATCNQMANQTSVTINFCNVASRLCPILSPGNLFLLFQRAKVVFEWQICFGDSAIQCTYISIQNLRDIIGDENLSKMWDFLFLVACVNWYRHFPWPKLGLCPGINQPDKPKL